MPHSLPQIECIDDQLAQILRNQSPAESVAQINSANEMARLLLAAGIRRQYPDWSDDAVSDEVARRMLRAAD